MNSLKFFIIQNLRILNIKLHSIFYTQIMIKINIYISNNKLTKNIKLSLLILISKSSMFLKSIYFPEHIINIFR